MKSSLLTLLTVVAAQTEFRTWEQALDLAKEQISKLNLKEKVTLASGVGWGQMEGNACVGNIASVPSIPNFNGLCLQDSPTGVRFTHNISSFTASINVASTFDRNMMLKNGQLMGKEFRGKGVNIALSPMMNMHRAPLGGRNWEGQGSDPYLTSQSARLQVRGIQQQGVIATAKHWIGNEQEHGRETSSSNIDDRTLHEIYMPAFQACIEEGVGAIMCAYNRLNGTYACENEYSINHTLKGELGFKGIVMTDWWAAHDKLASAKVSDMLMPGNSVWASTEFLWGENLVKSVEDKEILEARISDMATRILGVWYKLGQDKGFPVVNLHSFEPTKDQQVNVQSDHGKFIREVGAASSILLKNDGILPLKSNQSFAVIGNDAGPGNITNNSCPDHGCTDGTVAQGWGSGTANFPYFITPLEGITVRATKDGSSVTSYLENNFDDSMDLVKDADVALVFVAANSGEAFITVDGNAGDRNDFKLWNNGDGLIAKAVSSGKKVVVVIHGPGAVEMPWLNDVSAVILALMPGQEAGNAIADVLFGDVNPSARLPFTINAKLSEYSAAIAYNIGQGDVNYDEKLLVDYRYNDAMNISPLFEFGYGLSYTEFIYSNFAQSTDVVYPTSDKITVTFNVKNSGSHDGNEIPQLYLGFPKSAGEPPKQLKNFDKKLIQVGSSAQFSLDLELKDMTIWDVVSQSWVNVPGEYKLFVGSSSRDIKWQGSVVYKSSKKCIRSTSN
jgi:beta-glucosidase